MKLLDTDVFIYAQGASHPYREPCRAVLTAADPETYGVDVETLQEILDVYTRREQREIALVTVADVLAAFPDPFPIARREVEAAAGIVAAHERLSPRDAIHAAVVLTYGLEGIVSTDRAFDGVPGLVRFDPAELPRGGG